MDAVRLGPVDDPATDMGSLISLRRRDKVAGMVEDARRTGATVVRGGKIPDGLLGRAAYDEPTLITDTAQDSPIVRQEIFGPVLVCLPFDGDDEALRLANDTPYGLAASAWTTNVYAPGADAGRSSARCVPCRRWRVLGHGVTAGAASTVAARAGRCGPGHRRRLPPR